METEDWCCEMQQNKAAGPEAVPPIGPTALPQPARAVSCGMEAREELLWFQRWDGMEAQGGREG